VQRLTVIPLIETAETYEAAQHANSGASHEEEGWQPANSRERTFFTAMTTSSRELALRPFCLEGSRCLVRP